MPQQQTFAQVQAHPFDGALFRLFDAASVGVAVYTCAGEPVYLNAAMERLADCGVQSPHRLFADASQGGGCPLGERALFRAVASGAQAFGSMRVCVRTGAGQNAPAQADLFPLADVQTNTRYILRLLRLLPPDAGTEPEGPQGARSQKAYAALQMLTQTILGEHTLSGLMSGVHRVMRELMPAENCSIALTDGPGSRIAFPYFSDTRRTTPSVRDFGNGLTEFVFVWGRPFLITRCEIEELESKGIVCPAVPRPAVWLGVPLRTHAGRNVGVLAVRSYSDDDVYTPEDLNLLELISGYVGGAIETFQQREALRASEARFRAVFEHSGLGVCMVGPQGTVLESNGRMAEMFETRADALPGTDITACIVDQQDRAEALRQFAELHSGRLESFTLSCECRLASGALFWCRQTFTAVLDLRGTFSFAVVLMEDITEHKLADDRLMHMAFHDALTGLPNRSLFMDRLAGAARRARRHPEYRFAVLFMDMDRFKVVNDSMGHKAGDALLMQFAQRVKRCLRDCDTLARFGGDEFAILLDDIGEAFQATHAVQRILDELKMPFSVSGVDVYSGASIGAVFQARDYERPEDILRDADAAMYRAKEAGPGRYEVFDRRLNERMKDMLQLENAIRRGLEFSEFVPVFQPYVTLQSGRVRGAEVLARWRQPGGTLRMPDEFVGAAEEAGLVFGLDCQMLECGCAVIKSWRGRSESVRPMVLNLNVSALSFRRWDFLDVFTSIISRSGCVPSDICLEITENTLLKGDEAVSGRLWKLKELGVRVALDDFGTGFSSFNYLRQFPVNMIKVDRTFTSTVLDDRASRGIVQAIVSLGRGLGIEVVAEGVETQEQAAVLAELGCEAAQGYLFSCPVAQDRLFRIMEHGRLPFEVG